MKMTPEKITENLEIEAKKLISLADKIKVQADKMQFQADNHHKSGKIAEAKESTRKAKECAVKQKECRKRAEDAINLAQKVRAKDRKSISDIDELHRLMNQCKSNEACKFLEIVIKKFILEKTEPYSTHLRKCGELYGLTQKS
jgi:hypothetical protein